MAGGACSGLSDRIPVPNDEQQDRIARLAQQLADANRPDRVAELRTLLDSFSQFPPAAAATESLAQALATATAQGELTDADRGALARHLYDAMHGGYLRRTALDALTTSVLRILHAGGVPFDAQNAVALAVRRVAREEQRPRADWW